MPPAIIMDAFRLRWRPKHVQTSEEDSDLSSSPERGTRRMSFHISAPKNGHKNAALFVSTSDDEKPAHGAPGKASVSGNRSRHQDSSEGPDDAEQVSKHARKSVKAGLVR
ncbi:hypothetical protein BV22DRAFT_78058 [Leucogyrophana mollusca]|uniref:Uncharacterized protein n=1 Tax=Leucogyrophana mollusca TaxID=85980 RepID=A0ACB8BW77_9AGAM|nr:hypothetical protein BV22DRAFT_78058 [Leucogyrophana mollusca]